ncbi:protein of unknown function [Aminobacter niigataensis]|nr:protein of unknown function [Aminobacter niigataensis]
MLDGVQARAFGEHPAGEDAPDLAVERDLVDFDERVRLRLLVLRPRIADTRRHLQCAELHGFIDIDVESDDAAGDLVDASELGDRILDALRLGCGLRRRLSLARGRLGFAGQRLEIDGREIVALLDLFFERQALDTVLGRRLAKAGAQRDSSKQSFRLRSSARRNPARKCHTVVTAVAPGVFCTR